MKYEFGSLHFQDFKQGSVNQPMHLENLNESINNIGERMIPCNVVCDTLKMLMMAS